MSDTTTAPSLSIKTAMTRRSPVTLPNDRPFDPRLSFMTVRTRRPDPKRAERNIQATPVAVFDVNKIADTLRRDQLDRLTHMTVVINRDSVEELNESPRDSSFALRVIYNQKSMAPLPADRETRRIIHKFGAFRNLSRVLVTPQAGDRLSLVIFNKITKQCHILTYAIVGIGAFHHTAGSTRARSAPAFGDVQFFNMELLGIAVNDRDQLRMLPVKTDELPVEEWEDFVSLNIIDALSDTPYWSYTQHIIATPDTDATAPNMTGAEITEHDLGLPDDHLSIAPLQVLRDILYNRMTDSLGEKTELVDRPFSVLGRIEFEKLAEEGLYRTVITLYDSPRQGRSKQPRFDTICFSRKIEGIRPIYEKIEPLLNTSVVEDILEDESRVILHGCKFFL